MEPAFKCSFLDRCILAGSSGGGGGGGPPGGGGNNNNGGGGSGPSNNFVPSNDLSSAPGSNGAPSSAAPPESAPYIDPFCSPPKVPFLWGPMLLLQGCHNYPEYVSSCMFRKSQAMFHPVATWHFLMSLCLLLLCLLVLSGSLMSSFSCRLPCCYQTLFLPKDAMCICRQAA